MRGKRKKDVVEEYLRGGTSYRELGLKYGISSSTLQRWVGATGREEKDGEEAGSGSRERKEEVDPAAEIRRLQEELRRERLRTQLLNAMIDIAEEQFEIPIRKKRGARR